MAVYVIIGALVIVIAVYFIFRPKPKSGLDGYFISTQSQSTERVKRLNLDKISENASYILDTNKLLIPEVKREVDNVEYKADPETQWIINLIQPEGKSFRREDLRKMFDYEWRSKYRSSIFGFSPDEGRWTYADAGDSTDIYSKLQLAIDVQDVYNDENPDYDPEKLERYLLELKKRIKRHPSKIKLELTETIDNAVSKAKTLVQLHNNFDHDAIIVLQSGNKYNGREAWDALQSVGLVWGDGDLFHWNNDNVYGHDQHFSVWTTSEPGYFLPEVIAEGNMKPDNLIFGFSIPRSADPKNIFDIMLNAVKYCQKRLGGRLLDQNGEPFSEEQEKQSLVELIGRMEKAGIIAGSGKALRMF